MKRIVKTIPGAALAAILAANLAGCAGGADFGAGNTRPAAAMTSGGFETAPEASAPGEGIYNDNTVTGDGTRTSM